MNIYKAEYVCIHMNVYICMYTYEYVCVHIQCAYVCIPTEEFIRDDDKVLFYSHGSRF